MSKLFKDSMVCFWFVFAFTIMIAVLNVVLEWTAVRISNEIFNITGDQLFVVCMVLGIAAGLANKWRKR